jgi:hypothetical protein
MGKSFATDYDNLKIFVKVLIVGDFERIENIKFQFELIQKDVTVSLHSH